MGLRDIYIYFKINFPFQFQFLQCKKIKKLLKKIEKTLKKKTNTKKLKNSKKICFKKTKTLKSQVKSSKVVYNKFTNFIDIYG